MESDKSLKSINGSYSVFNSDTLRDMIVSGPHKAAKTHFSCRY